MGLFLGSFFSSHQSIYLSLCSPPPPPHTAQSTGGREGSGWARNFVKRLEEAARRTSERTQPAHSHTHTRLPGVRPGSSPVALGTFQPGGLIFWCPIFLPFHTGHGLLEARILRRFAVSSSRGPRPVRTLHCELSLLGGPTCMSHSFTEFTQAPLPR